MMQVIKRDGNPEGFSKDKIIRVCMAAGLEQVDAQKVAANIEVWAAQADGQKLTSLQIRDKVIEELKKVKPQAADFFVWYQNGKDKNSE